MDTSTPTQERPAVARKGKSHYAVWTAHVVLGLLFLWAGAIKLILPPESLAGPVPLPILFMRFIGVAEALGGLGLILPGVLGIYRMLTPLAAMGLAIIMVGAIVIGVIGGPIWGALFPLVVLLLLLWIAYERRHWR